VSGIANGSISSRFLCSVKLGFVGMSWGSLIPLSWNEKSSKSIKNPSPEISKKKGS
jgi:hypothetical protein